MLKKIFSGLFICLSLMTACQPNQPPAEFLTQTDETVLTVAAPGYEMVYRLEDLQSLPGMIGYGGSKNGLGQISLPQLYKGVPIIELINAAGGMNENMEVFVETQDGSTLTFSYDQIIHGNYVTYDPASGDEMINHGPLTTLVAYEMNGKLFDPNTEGMLHLIPAGGNAVITDEYWSVENITRIIIREIQAGWSIQLEGAINETLNRDTFNSSQSTTWTDSNGNQWTGIPLYYLIGRVDDEIKENDDAYNEDLAINNAYTIEVLSHNGTTVELDSIRVMGNQNILIAYAKNGEPLDENDAPLKLTGDDLTRQEMIGMIDKIVLHFIDQPSGGDSQPSSPVEP